MSGSASATSTLRTICSALGAERLRGFDVPIGHAGDRGDRVRIHERHARDEDEHHLLRLVDAEPEDRQRNQRRDRQIAAEERDRRAGRFDHAPRSGDDAERHADEHGQSEPDQHALQRRGDALQERAFVEQARKASDHFARARQDHRRDPADPRLRSPASQPPQQHDDADRARRRPAAASPGRRDAAAPEATAWRRTASTSRPPSPPPDTP